MTAPAIVDLRLVPLCREMERAFPVFQRELTAIPEGCFVPWPDRGAYSHGWLTFLLVLAMDPVPPAFDLERNRRLCPESFALLARHERVLAAGVSRLLPGCRVHPHRDFPKRGVLRYHLGLSDSQGAGLSFEGAEVETRRGLGLLFDHSLPHAAYNRGDAPRDVLVVDYEVDAREAEALLAARGGVNLGPSAPTA